MAELEIVKAEFYRAVSKISKPIADSTHTISKIAFYVMEITLRNGVKGQGYLLSFHYSPNAIEGALKDICNFLRENEYETYETVRMKQDWDKEAEYFGNTGIEQLCSCCCQRCNVGCMGTCAEYAGMEDFRFKCKKDSCIWKWWLDQLYR